MEPNKITKAIQSAHQSYEDLSGDWLWEGAEYYLTVCLAQDLRDVFKWVTVEAPVASEFIRRKQGRPPLSARHGGRVDLAFWKNDEISGIMEVKSSVHPGTCLSDLDRLLWFMKGTHIEFASFAYWTSVLEKDEDTASMKLESRAEALDASWGGRAKDNGIAAEFHSEVFGKYVDDDGGVSMALAWAATFSKEG